jgi:hypothetical protein
MLSQLYFFNRVLPTYIHGFQAVQLIMINHPSPYTSIRDSDLIRPPNRPVVYQVIT